MGCLEVQPRQLGGYSGNQKAPPYSCPVDQDDALGAGSSTILGQGPWRLGSGWPLLYMEQNNGCIDISK